MYVALTKNRYMTDKQIIDDFIKQTLKSRVSYILRSKNPYLKCISFTKDNRITMMAITRNRFYFEIKLERMIKNEIN